MCFFLFLSSLHPGADDSIWKECWENLSGSFTFFFFFKRSGRCSGPWRNIRLRFSSVGKLRVGPATITLNLVASDANTRWMWDSHPCVSGDKRAPTTQAGTLVGVAGLQWVSHPPHPPHPPTCLNRSSAETPLGMVRPLCPWCLRV